MTRCIDSELAITGVGVTSAIGQGKAAFTSALMAGYHNFGIMQRPGRQNDTSFLGAEITSLAYPHNLSQRLLRTASLSGRVAMVTVDEAWRDANLADVEPRRIGLVIGGSNVQQRESVQIYERYARRPTVVPPTYALSFMDTDLCGLCTAQFNIRGIAYTVGAASASGQVAILQGIQAIQAGQVDACIALGAMTDISFWECQALRSLGAMGSDRYSSRPEMACRPFDQNRDGFIFGECCGAVVIEDVGRTRRPNVNSYAILSGWAVVMDGNRNPDPSYEGEVRVIADALEMAGLAPSDVDYVNPHGTGSIIGDRTEYRAILDSGLSHAYINATKSIVGHGLSAAGTVEIIATLLQMERVRLHPTRNLDCPIGVACNWVGQESIYHEIKNALNLSMGFGGINTAICLQNSRTADMRKTE